MEISIACVFCKKYHIIKVSEKGYKKWKAGELIQRALPKLSADERELLISGTCQECWDKSFK